MLYLNMEDGLGNQLFQYAFARSLQKMYGEPLWITLAQFDLKSQAHPKMRYILKSFALAPNVHFVEGPMGRLLRWRILTTQWFYRFLYYPLRGNKPECTRRANRHGLYFDFTGGWWYVPPEPTRRRDKLITGRFQSEKYFAAIADTLRAELRITAPLSDTCRRDCATLRADPASVAVHIRRGDYLDGRHDGLKLCDEEYYHRAMKIVLERVPQATFYIFSNSPADIAFIRQNYRFPSAARVLYRDGTAPALEDFAAMQACRHFIISNSSFGWWAQYLSENRQDHVVVAPRPWNRLGFRDEDVYQPDWITVDL